MRINLALLGVALFATGCGNADPATQAAPPEPIAEVSPAPAPATPEEWRAALESTYRASSVEDTGDGITTLIACFDRAEKECNHLSWGKRDAFRKVWYFTPGLLSETAVGTYLVSYVSVPENSYPRIVLAPTLFNEQGGIFIRSLAVMIDGEVEIEQEFTISEIKREDYPAGTQERVDFIASDEQIAALRKVGPESTILVRINGRDSFVSLDKPQLESVRDEVLNLLHIYDAISAATTGKIPPQ